MLQLSKMQMTVTLLLLLVFGTTGCQNEAASKLVGRWDMLPPEKISDEDAGDTEASDEKAVDDTENLYNSVAGGEIEGSMSLVFHRNGKLETFTDFPMASTGEPKVGKWSLLSWDENGQVATLRCDLFDEVTETRVTFIDDDTIQLIPPNIAVLELELRFRRKK